MFLEVIARIYMVLHCLNSSFRSWVEIYSVVPRNSVKRYLVLQESTYVSTPYCIAPIFVVYEEDFVYNTFSAVLP